MRHAWAILAIGALVVIGGLLSAWEGSIRPTVSAMLAVSVSASLRSMFRDKSVVFKRADSGLGLKPISETGSTSVET
jgi:hypothetical protein